MSVLFKILVDFNLTLCIEVTVKLSFEVEFFYVSLQILTHSKSDGLYLNLYIYDLFVTISLTTLQCVGSLYFVVQKRASPSLNMNILSGSHDVTST